MPHGRPSSGGWRPATSPSSSWAGAPTTSCTTIPTASASLSTPPPEQRVQRIQDQFHTSPEQARRDLEATDRGRSWVYKQCTGRSWGTGGTITWRVDSGKLGIDGSVELISTPSGCGASVRGVSLTRWPGRMDRTESQYFAWKAKEPAGHMACRFLFVRECRCQSDCPCLRFRRNAASRNRGRAPTIRAKPAAWTAA